MSSTQAATIGKTVVTSAQHEPLTASIMVTGIQAADFSASLASPVIYQQMGLTPTDSMTIRFTPTSATSGQVFISTSKPVSKPFADVVLAINDNGQRNVVPKTLLMPLSDSLPIDTTKHIVTGAKKPNLPSVSASVAKPLTVREGAPPPLISAPSRQASSIQTPTVTATPQSNHLAYAPSRLDSGRLADARLNSDNSAVTIRTNNGTNNTDSNSVQRAAHNQTGNKTDVNDAATIRGEALVKDSNTPTTVTTNKPLDVLNIQVTRQIQPSGQSEKGMVTTTPTLPAPEHNEANTLKTVSASNVPASTVEAATPNVVRSSSNTNTIAANSTTAQYQVQRNDSLWIIAQQIAQENNLDIQTVMKQIQSQNPDAFINKDADQLKADAKLHLPSYDVIPSQKDLEAAISAQRLYSRRTNPLVPKKSAKSPSNISSETTKAAKRSDKPTTTKTQTLPKAQFSVLAPGSDGRADGTQEKSAATTGNGVSTDILATLKASRQTAASQAQRLSKTSSALDSYTKKIQLQNQKLAELQARLKKLRNQ
ncbi:type IV pilus assembly protein FimV [Psychrobacter namhaensis]|uniref:type IV pilus assembly protein FimV n=1 Tax=Psychrobacter namhaensis TaxID=292734 RepID=UPI003FD328FE